MPLDSRYEFVTQWQIPAPIENVWVELMKPEDWPTWWRGVQKVESLRPGHDELGVGAIRKYTWRSKLPYQLTFTMETVNVQPYSQIEGIATGELEGRGCWHLSHTDGTTHVRYDWQVIANKWWMVWLAPLAKPLFEWNHDAVMEWGREGMILRVSNVHPR